MPEEDRPREKLQTRGPGALTDAEILAIFIRMGPAGSNAMDVARDLLKAFGNLQGVARATAKQLQEINGIGPAKATELAAAIELGSRLARQRGADRVLDTPEAVYEMLALEMQALDRERLVALLLDTKNRLIRIENISVGSLNEVVAHPREILKPAVIHSAHGFILVHNHPSGDPQPSAADRQLTRRLNEAADTLRISLFDHVIIGQENDRGEPYFSFREAGLL